MLWTALTQWQNAKKLRDDINQSLKKKLNKEEYARQAWTLRHAFFATMGGFEIDVDEKYEWILEKKFGGKQKRVLNAWGLIALEKLDSLPVIDVETIKARSKADTLAKTLVCFQAIEMIVQVIARKAAGLPITLLELNTLAHVGCAVVMYALWWYKPQNVQETQKIMVEPALAFLLGSYHEDFPLARFTGTASGERHKAWKSTSRSSGATSSNSASRSAVESRTTEVQVVAGRGYPRSKNTRSRNATRELSSDLGRYTVIGTPVGSVTGLSHISRLGPVRAKPGKLHNSCLVLLPGQSISGVPFRNDDETTALLLNKRDIQILELKRDTSKTRLEQLQRVIFRGAECLISAASNVVTVDMRDALSSQKTLASFAILGLLYGGIHASSWNGHFPTVIERLLWHISVCIVGGGGFVLWAFSFWRSKVLHKFYRAEGLAYEIYNVSEVVFYMMLLLLIPYCGSRMFLVGESFISVRSLPMGAYNTTNWINVLPHIG